MMKHLPRYGVGPWYVIACVILTVLGLILEQKGLLASGDLWSWRILFLVCGVALIVLGSVLWFSAIVVQKIGKDIENNRLATEGVYAWVRNPIYSGIVMVLTGILLLAHNLWLLLIPVLFWAMMTILMKATEEKWLLALYGEEYRAYCRRVNRCVPWFPRKSS